MHRVMGLGLAAVLLLGSPSWGGASPRRAEALQLYQEGLFQETGTGDLTMAIKIYVSLLEHFPEYRDLAAVSLYHLGLLHEKSGDRAHAYDCFHTLATQYPDQTPLAEKVKLKLQSSAYAPSESFAALSSAVESPGPTPAAAPLGTSQTAAVNTEDSGFNLQGAWGVGLNNSGVHASYGVSPDLHVMVKSQWLGQHALTGLRLIHYLGPSPLLLLKFPYFGLETDYTQEVGNAQGYIMGGFAGTAWFFAETLSIGADVGYYYQRLFSGTINSISTTVSLNILLTYYF